jgi:hypothetical protein
MSAAIRTQPALSASEPRVLFEGSFDAGAAASPAYDVSADGMRFLMLRSPRTAADPASLMVTLGWTGTLR